MHLYEYSWHNRYSTKAANIIDEQNNTVGTIKKKYPNVFIRILDILLEGGYFVEYEMFDSHNQFVFNAKANLNPFKRRQYTIDYFESDHHFQVHLIDKKMLDIVEVTDFDFNGENFTLTKEPFEWAKLHLNGNLLAEWHLPFKSPFNYQLKLYNNEYLKSVLFLIGIFHTYFHCT